MEYLCFHSKKILTATEKDTKFACYEGKKRLKTKLVMLSEIIPLVSDMCIQSAASLKKTQQPCQLFLTLATTTLIP